MKHLYEIHTAVWLTRLSSQFGHTVTLANVPDETIDHIVSFGMDTVWLMGIWQRSTMAAGISRRDEGLWAEIQHILPDATHEDIIGSAYAIGSYAVDPHFGGTSGLAIFRQQLAARGIRLILDFVPNHTAPDHEWLTLHLDYYITGDLSLAEQQPTRYFQTAGISVAKGADPNLPAWPDVAQLNAYSPGYRQASIDTLLAVADMCDGVRCDMAMLMLNDVVERSWGEAAGSKPPDEYWQAVIESVRATKHEFTFIAECYWDTERKLIELGFDYCYDKRVYDAMVADNHTMINTHSAQLADISSKLLHFLENHDEQRAATIFSNEQQQTYARQIIDMPGICLWNDGQFEGYRAKLPTHIRRGPIEPTNAAIEAIYHSLLS